MKKLRVLVIDDSAFMRKLISEILNSDSEIEVVGKASNGLDGIEKVKKLKPDVVTLDIKMPDISGLDVLNEIMDKFPTPVVIISAYAKKGSYEAIQAFEYGAVEVVAKPSGEISMDLKDVKEDIILAVKIASKVDVKKLAVVKSGKVLKGPSKSKKELLVIGASTGGPQAVSRVLSSLPENFPVPIIVVQHMDGNFTSLFAQRLNSKSQLEVREARSGDVLKRGNVYVVPGDYHLEVVKKEKKAVVKLVKKKEKELCSINRAIESSVDVFEDGMIAVILSGMGCDGSEGVRKMKKRGGVSIVQDEDTCVVFGMPKEVIENKDADFVLPLDKISGKIVELL